MKEKKKKNGEREKGEKRMKNLVALRLIRKEDGKRGLLRRALDGNCLFDITWGG